MTSHTLTGSNAALMQSYLDNLVAAASPEAAAAPGEPVDHAAGGREALAATVSTSPHRHARPFQALLFRVRGVQLAAPLLRLSGALPWTDRITGVPEHPDRLLGVLVHRGRRVRVIDTARLILPSQNIDVARPSRHIVLLDRGGWGMTCDGLSEVLYIEPGAVKWREHASRRPWLAGMLRQRRCGLIDVDALAGMLGGPVA